MDTPRATPSGSGYSGHPSRRDNQSVSSTHSSRSERSGRSGQNPAVESAVTRLLVSIKQLLEALTSWSTLQFDENQVSDVYVRLGNDFNAAVAAFGAFNIDMSELLSVPEDLRAVLEQCLAEDATPENLETYLPKVRLIITNLLQGLRGKQTIYRRLMSEQKHRSDQSTSAGAERADSRSSRVSRREREGSHRSQLSRTSEDGGRGERDSISRRSAQSSRRQPSGQSQNAPLPSMNEGDERFVGGFAPPNQNSPMPATNGDVRSKPPPSEDPNSTPPSNQHRRQKSVPRTSDSPMQPSGMPLPTASNPVQSGDEPLAPEPPTPPAVPSNVKRYSLVDRPMPIAPPPPVLVIEQSSPDLRQDSPQPTPPPDAPPGSTLAGPELASLAALKKSDALERRASKRFSSYHISKMTGSSTTREKSTRGAGNANRRSLLLAGPALTPGELDVLTEEDDEVAESPATPVKSSGSLRRENSARSRVRARTGAPEARPGSPTPPVPRTPSKSPVPPPAATPSHVEQNASSSPDQSTDSNRFPIFMQLGREVKKVAVEPGMTFSSLRMLFVDRFSYNPGLENFPAIYIQDPSSGVQYELEDVEEVKERCLLSLNIEPLDQIKQHIDAQISTLSQDLKDLRAAVSNNNRHSQHLGTIMTQPLAESTPPRARPSERDFQTVARRLSRFVSNEQHLPSSPTPTLPMLPQMTGQSLQPQMTGGSVLSEYTSRVVTDLKTQFDEVQNLRRDLGVMRQLYTGFMTQTKESLGALRTQTQSVKQLASTRVGGAREYIDTGKKKLDERSQNVLTEVEKLQDTVENIKDDVVKRHITPKPQLLKNLKKDVDNVAAELTSLREHIKTIKPMWKQTWAEELQNVVEEQHFLNHQEQLLGDLLEDHKEISEVYGHVHQIIGLRGSAPRAKSFKLLPAPEEGAGLNSVMMEIRGASVDPERRMKAIEASQKSREKDMANREDDLHAELFDFVGQKKLKMTGGAEEAERVRQKRSEMTLKAMFNGGSSVGAPSPLGSPTT
ncbi:hypothetical protein HGRIS_004575 [Hohenbuehelia grisea]|uniref:Actin interacting protein 3 C-terminal domain-containing protein n=1 Tax=Hohenbuehelia grisea TaxID=104357 RepID=A0ABR3JCA7_9AGAR